MPPPWLPRSPRCARRRSPGGSRRLDGPHGIHEHAAVVVRLGSSMPCVIKPGKWALPPSGAGRRVALRQRCPGRACPSPGAHSRRCSTAANRSESPGRRRSRCIRPRRERAAPASGQQQPTFDRLAAVAGEGHIVGLDRAHPEVRSREARIQWMPSAPQPASASRIDRSLPAPCARAGTLQLVPTACRKGPCSCS